MPIRTLCTRTSLPAGYGSIVNNMIDIRFRSTLQASSFPAPVQRRLSHSRIFRTGPRQIPAFLQLLNQALFCPDKSLCLFLTCRYDFSLRTVRLIELMKKHLRDMSNTFKNPFSLQLLPSHHRLFQIQTKIIKSYSLLYRLRLKIFRPNTILLQYLRQQCLPHRHKMSPVIIR